MDNDDELKNVLKQLSNEEEIQENNKDEEKTKTKNADYLEKMAYVNVILFVIGAIYVIANSFVDEMNLIGITIGIATLIVGFTLFFLLRTIVDIYRKVEK